MFSSPAATKIIYDRDAIQLFEEAIEDMADQHQALLRRRTNRAPSKPEPREIREIRERNEARRRKYGGNSARSAAPRAGTAEAARYIESLRIKYRNQQRMVRLEL